jgi:hypothetical protein
MRKYNRQSGWVIVRAPSHLLHVVCPNVMAAVADMLTWTEQLGPCIYKYEVGLTTLIEMLQTYLHGKYIDI